MALKVYEYLGSTWQFDDATAPVGAVEVKASVPANKSVAPVNKAANYGNAKPTNSRKL